MIAVIGNGPSLLKSGLGKVIDKADTVIRFSNFKIKGFERDVGTKTDIWFGYFNVRKDIHKFKKVIFPWIGKVNIQNRYCKIESECRKANIPLERLDETIVQKSYALLNLTYPGKPKPTCGFAGIVYALSLQDSVYIAGFDSYKGMEFYYDLNKPRGNIFRAHFPAKEYTVIQQWLKEGTVHLLTKDGHGKDN